MEYQIKKMPAFRVAGYKFSISILNEEQLVQIPALWNLIKQDGRYEKLYQAMHQENNPFYEKQGLLGVCTIAENANEGQLSMDYYIGYIAKNNPPPGMDICEIPAATWAIFPCVGPMPEALRHLTDTIYSSWIETGPYEYAFAPDIEFYPDGDFRSETYESEAWASVKLIEP